MSTRARVICCLALAVPGLALASPAVAAAATTKRPHLLGLRCVPATAKGCRAIVQTRVGGQVQLRGRRLYAGMRVTFRWETGAVATTLRKRKAGWIAKVPAGTRTGMIGLTVRDRARRRSNVRRMRVVLPAPAPSRTATTAGLPQAFRGAGMWIWYVAKSDGGDVAAIGARARAAGIGTVFVKAADGTRVWAQFTPELVAALRAEGLKVCAWQYVYGVQPAAEAAAAAAAVARGADCFVIDVESEYAKRYAAAQVYMNALRTAVGATYPLGFTSFPYVHYHSTVPYSVFLGPGAAQVNVPQIYWKTIGTTVENASAITLTQNRIYRAPIAPLGQSYDSPPDADVQAFRRIWTSYGAEGMSWWSWQAASAATWSTLALPVPPLIALADPGWPALKKGAKGDQVIWLQQHLASVDATVPIDGTFDARTDAALRSFQTGRGMVASGITDAATWQAVLALPVRPVDWTLPTP